MSDVLSATVISRIETLTDEGLVGLTIAQVRTDFGEALNIPEDALAFLNGAELSEDDVVQAGDKIRFNLSVGEKGSI